jgi:hypothetical protein
MRSYLKNPFTKIGLVKWLEVRVLISITRTPKKKKKKNSWE